MSGQVYKPREGSAAEAAMAHLKAFGTCDSAKLAVACDQSANALTACLSTAVRFGAIRRVVKNGAVTWSLGDEIDDAPVIQRIVPAAGQPLPVEVLTSRPTDRELLEEPAGAALAQAAVRAMVAEPSPAVAKPEATASVDLRHMTGRGIVMQALSEEVRDGFDRTFDAPLERAAQDALLAPSAPLVTRAVPCIPVVTVSFNLTPHQAERLCAFAAAMTEVRS